MMKEENLGDLTLSHIEFDKLQSQVLEIVCLMLAKKDISLEDYRVIDNALNLWVACLLKNPELIKNFYNFDGVEIADDIDIKSAEDFILAGIYNHKFQKVAEEFNNTLFTICTKIVTDTSETPPINFVINVLKINFPREDNHYSTRYCRSYYDLFCRLI